MLQIHPLLSTLLPNQYPGSTETVLRQLRQYCDSTERVLRGSTGTVLGQFWDSTQAVRVKQHWGTVLVQYWGQQRGSTEGNIGAVLGQH